MYFFCHGATLHKQHRRAFFGRRVLQIYDAVCATARYLEVRVSRILITGSSGLIGSALLTSLPTAKYDLVGIDIRPPTDARAIQLDTTNVPAMAELVGEFDGVVHLAAVSRVIHGEQDPNKCRAVNVGGTMAILSAIQASRRRPWLVFGSSREVYGEPALLPVAEDAPLQPINIYGQTKMVGERCVEAHVAAGFPAAIVRFSNVYGNANTDHVDRVVPAFCRAAISGTPLRIDGGHNTFDFTHIADVARGLELLMDSIGSSEHGMPPIHFVSGVATTLHELAQLVVAQAGGSPTIVEAPSRSYDVSRFWGDFSRARQLLGWSPQVSLREGLTGLICDIRDQASLVA
jgi:nucleoside-diphosphate-sugar epimerase